jgi:hypothetical protein
MYVCMNVCICMYMHIYILCIYVKGEWERQVCMYVYGGREGQEGAKMAIYLCVCMHACTYVCFQRC